MKHHPNSGKFAARLAPAALAASILLSAPALAAGDTAVRLDALQKQLQQVQATLRELADENRALRGHERELDRQLAQLKGAAPAVVAPAAAAPAAAPTSTAGEGTAPASASPLPAGSVAPAGSLLSSLGSGLRLWGYGELYYTNPVDERAQTRFDLARAVFGIGYAFDERTEFNSEFEVEHAVASSSDPGEFEVEQFYVDHRLNDALAVRAGLFLMPFGFINENHEPTNFYGVQRNFVETLIIPSTWREGGFNLHGSTSGGFGWNVGVTTGFDLTKWDFAPEFPLYRTAAELIDGDAGPLHATHQELALANARNLSQYVALSYFGVPGLTLGGAIFTGNAVPVGPGAQRVTLWEGHARWMPGKWDLTALYAHGSISNTAPANMAHPGSPNPLPADFYGYYAQAAYQLWERGPYRLNPFVRFERYNLGSSYSGTIGPAIPSGAVPMSDAPGDLGLWPQNHDRVWSAGANLYITPHVVLKGDFQWFSENADFKRFDLGLGVAF